MKGEGGNMEFRLADKKDLPQLKSMYKKIIDQMNKNNIEIWDDVYPCELFEKDIEAHSLYVLLDQETIVAAFVLSESNDGEKAMTWANKHEKAFYIDRFGVSVDYLRKGIGSQMLKKAIDIALVKGAKYLRLFVVDINQPAIHLYIKNGFKRVEGIYEEAIDDTLTLYEYGFEMELIKSKVM